MDDTPSGAGEGSMDYKILARATHDTITCIKASERLLIVVSMFKWFSVKVCCYLNGYLLTFTVLLSHYQSKIKYNLYIT